MNVAIISEHASPLAATASVDVFTRRDRALLPTVSKLSGNIRVVHVPAGPATHISKESLMAIGPFLIEKPGAAA